MAACACQERRARDLDAHNTRVIDFELAFSTLPLSVQTLLVLVYGDKEPVSHAAAVLGVSTRKAVDSLPAARIALADALDRRHLL